MKRSFVLSCMLAVYISSSGQELNVMTFNIRYNRPADSLDAWIYRKDNLASQVLFHEIELLGVQEALHDQMMDLQQRLTKFRYIGAGRDDGKEKGEYSAIFYDTTKLQLLQSKTFWLSETPEAAGSKSWDAAITRVVTWAQFRFRKSNRIFFAFNTHFDHIGKVARKESARIVLDAVKKIAGNVPVVFTGDFNSRPSEEPVMIITDNANPLHLTDSKDISRTPHYGPTGTANNFQSKERDDDPIDYIFLKGKWRVLTHATISESWGGRYASDHFSVTARIAL